MAKTIKKDSSDTKKDTNSKEKESFKMNRQYKVLFGSLLVLSSVALLLSFISFFIYGQVDQNAINSITDRNATVQNWSL